jgi:hypothetical protein
MRKTRNQEQIINEIELLLAELRQAPRSDYGKQNSRGKAHLSPPKPVAPFSGIIGEIYALVEEGFFKEPRELSEIQKKLKDEGIVKPTTSLMPPLTRLVRKKILGRNKPPKGKYKYFQRQK